MRAYEQFPAEPSWPEAATFSIDEVALAAGVTVEEVWQTVEMGQAVVYGTLVSTADAAHLVRVLRGDVPPSPNRTPIHLRHEPKGKTRVRLAAAGILYMVGAVALLVLASLGLLSANTTEETIRPDPEPVRLVYLMSPGPGGGGGGGGLQAPIPPPPAAKKSPAPVKKMASRVPPAKPRPAPPAPRPTSAPPVRVEQRFIETPPKPTPTPTPAVQAPVQSIAADPLETIGVPVDKAPSPPSQGRGTQGGIGSGAGVGIGEGTGGGIGPGSGGGTGGGPYQPGAGIDPPTLVREVRPNYTDEARRRAIEGDVVLEIVVRQDGSVGNVRVRRTLGAGLEQKAIDAVRQWKFTPARRHGAAVDVVVDVSVEFKLR
jgi:protein TonB